MTITNLSGNFHPLSSGSSLPPAGSTSVNEVAIRNAKPATSSPPKVLDELPAAQANTKQQADEQVENRASKKLYDDLSQISQNISRRLSFQVDNDSGKTVVRVFDRETEELIRQIPPEELLTLSKRLKELNDNVAGNISAGVLIKSEA